MSVVIPFPTTADARLRRVETEGREGLDRVREQMERRRRDRHNRPTKPDNDPPPRAA